MANTSERVKALTSTERGVRPHSVDVRAKAMDVKWRWDGQGRKIKRWTLSGDGWPVRRARAAADERTRFRSRTAPPRGAPIAERQGEARAERAAPEPSAQPPPRRQAQKKEINK